MTNKLPEDLHENLENCEPEEESSQISGDPLEPGKKETITNIVQDPDIDKWIGKGLKLPPVQNDGRW